MLSAVIIAWNEEVGLERALNSFRTLVDEIVVVVDQASTDNTAKVANKFTKHVFTHPHVGYVEPMRKFAIDHAHGDWILYLDADEELPPTLVAHIQKLLQNPSADYYRIPRQNIIFGKPISSQHWWPDYVHRLFKKDAIVWPDQIHGVPETRGVGEDLPASHDLAIIHHNYATISEYLEQIDRYTKHQLDHLITNNYVFNWVDLLDKPFHEFLRQYFAREGYRDGLHGLALALLQSFSELVLYLKAWEQTKFTLRDLTTSQVSGHIAKLSFEYRWWTAPTWVRPWLKLFKT